MADLLRKQSTEEKEWVEKDPITKKPVLVKQTTGRNFVTINELQAKKAQILQEKERVIAGFNATIAQIDKIIKEIENLPPL